MLCGLSVHYLAQSSYKTRAFPLYNLQEHATFDELRTELDSPIRIDSATGEVFLVTGLPPFVTQWILQYDPFNGRPFPKAGGNQDYYDVDSTFATQVANRLAKSPLSLQTILDAFGEPTRTTKTKDGVQYEYTELSHTTTLIVTESSEGVRIGFVGKRK